MSQLFSPVTLRGLVLRNRTVVAPMCQYSAVEAWPATTTWSISDVSRSAASARSWSRRPPSPAMAASRTAIWGSGPTTTSPRSPVLLHSSSSTARCPRSSSLMPAARAPRNVRGMAAGVSGAPKRRLVERPLGPSSPSSRASWRGVSHPPRPGRKGTGRVARRAYGDAAKRALKAGSRSPRCTAPTATCSTSFLSPAGNSRTDAYGGSLENRMRFPARDRGDRTRGMAGRPAAFRPPILRRRGGGRLDHRGFRRLCARTEGAWRRCRRLLVGRLRRRAVSRSIRATRCPMPRRSGATRASRAWPWV